MALIGDLARPLAIANPNPQQNPLQGSGFVIINEIELHLYPRWQRGIIPALTRTFPNCQFIVTTHSPQVISDVEWVQLLKITSAGIVIERLRSFDKDSNRILETLMGTPERPPEIEEKFQQLFRVIDRGELDNARQWRQQLAERVGENDPTFVRADGLIRQKEILNRDTLNHVKTIVSDLLPSTLILESSITLPPGTVILPRMSPVSGYIWVDSPENSTRNCQGFILICLTQLYHNFAQIARKLVPFL